MLTAIPVRGDLVDVESTNPRVAARLTASVARAIRSADKILVIRGGRITEAGTHDELLALGGYYYSLYTHQYRAEATRNAFEA